MRCLHAGTITTANARALKDYGGMNAIRNFKDISGLQSYVKETAGRYDFGDIQTICLAVYQIMKLHPFMDGNKRTANAILLNCLRKMDRSFTGRPKDLAYEIINLANSESKNKKEAILSLSYFVKAHLQNR